MMAKKSKKRLAMMLAIVIVLGTFLMPISAQEGTVEEKETIINTDSTVTQQTTTTTTEIDSESGDVTVTVEIEKDTTGTTPAGENVDKSESSTTTTVTDSEANLISETFSETTVENVVEDGVEKVRSSGASGGTEYSTEHESPENVDLDVPMTDVDDPQTTDVIENQSSSEFGDPVGTEKMDGDVPTSSTDGEYDYVKETTVKQGNVTITTTDITVTEKVDIEKTDLEHIKSETTPDGSNDIFHQEGSLAPEQYLPGYTGESAQPDDSKSEGTDGYDYIYVGTNNTSMFRPAVVFTEPLTDEQKLEQYGDNAYIRDNSITYYYVGWLTEEDRSNISKTADGKYETDEEGFILDKQGNRILKEERVTKGPDGETLYLHRFDNFGSDFYVEGWYENGDWEKELNNKDGDKYYAIWSGPQQFVLVDKNGEIVNAYCADLPTHTQNGYGYNVENLEDAQYYSEEEAKMIRTIVLNGYWGTVGNKTDADGNVVVDGDGNPVPKLGSLEAMLQALRSSGEFTEAELQSLNDGVAMTATQMAIWSCSNKASGIQFVNSHYGTNSNGNIPVDKEDEVKLIFKVFDYLRALTPTETKNTTADTIINADNFVDSMSVTVVEKDKNHVNNQDTDNTNDAYVTNLTFALVVKPSTENGDDLVVSVLNAQGEEIATARIAGKAKEGEKVLVPDENGNYCFEGITMVEGDQNFRLNLQGIQHLKEGVYLYSSEVRDTVSSQTLVSIAEGKRAVDVSMNITFNLSVDDEVVAVEHIWRDEWSDEKVVPPSTPYNTSSEEPTTPPPATVKEEPQPVVEIPDEEVPLADLVVIFDEDIPLASVPKTGDSSAVWFALSVLSAISLFCITVSDSKRKTNRTKHI